MWWRGGAVGMSFLPFFFPPSFLITYSLLRISRNALTLELTFVNPLFKLSLSLGVAEWPGGDLPQRPRQSNHALLRLLHRRRSTLDWRGTCICSMFSLLVMLIARTFLSLRKSSANPLTSPPSFPPSLPPSLFPAGGQEPSRPKPHQHRLRCQAFDRSQV